MKNEINIQLIESLTTETFNRLLKESIAMVNFSLSSGYDIPSSAFDLIVEIKQCSYYNNKKNKGLPLTDKEVGSLKKIVRIHSLLVEVISPATPRTAILMMDATKDPLHINMFFNASIFRNILLVVLISMAIFIFFGISPEIDMETRTKFIFLELSGLSLLKILIFLLSAASLGGSLACLLVVGHYLEKGLFDPIYNSSYWVRYIFSVIFGLLACTLLVHATPLGDKTLNEIGRPASAMIGGFSSHFLFPLLKSLLDMIGSIKFKKNYKKVKKRNN
ncbi:hypothetical protein ACJJIP_08310 [Microbulbifer sp. VTAC004]|uniref:hypothetical protein n=1 Tax=unclassified Microbulbifer TaxID=2619833 RepID=UPI00403A6C0E